MPSLRKVGAFPNKDYKYKTRKAEKQAETKGNE